MTDTGLGPNERVAMARLRALLELLPTALDKELADERITSFEFTLLEALTEAEHRRMRLSALAARTNSTLPRLSRVITSLEKKGLVLRAPCEEDGRATNAVITEAGSRVYESSAPRYGDAVRRMVLADLDGAGVEQLSELALSLLRKLDPDADPAGDIVCAADPVID